MERLTYSMLRDSENQAYESEYRRETLLHRLAAYEDTGLTPEQVAELAEKVRDGRLLVLPCKVGDTVYAIADCADILKDCDDDYYTGTGAITCPFEKDCEFEECDDANRRIFETYVRSIYKDKDEPVNIFLDKIVDRQFYPSDFGKTVFLTREAAEAALEGAEHE